MVATIEPKIHTHFGLPVFVGSWKIAQIFNRITFLYKPKRDW